MAKILFIHPIADSTFGRQSIPIALTSTLLKNEGHQYDIFDTTFLNTEQIISKHAQYGEVKQTELKMFQKYDKSELGFTRKKTDIFKELQNKIDNFKPDVITFSLWGSHLHAEGEYFAYINGLKLIEGVNTRGIKIITGGTIPSANPKKILSNSKIDFVIKGESELVYKDIMEKVQKNEDLKSIKNLNYIDENKNFIENPMRELIDPLDQLPDVSFDIFDPRTFKRPYHGKIKKMIDYELSRGCWYRCTFCLSPFQRETTYGKPKNFRREKSIPKIIREIKKLKNRYNLDMIRYQDESFNSISEDKLKDLSKDYKKYVDLPFIIEATVNTTTENKIKYLKQMGCVNVGFGIESGSQFVRDKIIIKPKFTNDDAVKKIHLLKKNGISVTSYNIMGFPNETEEHIIDTLILNNKSKPTHATVCYFQPWEGTSLKKTAIKDGFLDENIEISQMTEGQQTVTPLNLKIEKNILEHYHDYFSHYVYLNRWLWPLIKFCSKKNILSKITKNFLDFILIKNQKFYRKH